MVSKGLCDGKRKGAGEGVSLLQDGPEAMAMVEEAGQVCDIQEGCRGEVRGDEREGELGLWQELHRSQRDRPEEEEEEDGEDEEEGEK